MSTHDDELAALLALDALEPDEQADAELRMGTFGNGTSETSAALAEAVTARPPADLRAAMLARARERREPGRPVDGVTGCSAREGFERTIADLYDLLSSLSETEWNAHAHEEHGRARDLIAHLVGVDRLSLRWLDPDDDMPIVLDHVAATRPAVDELADVPVEQLLQIWYDGVRAVASAAATGDPSRRVPFHDMPTSVSGYLIARTFELWAHSMDISVATGRPLLELDPERMLTLSSRLMGFVPLTLAYRGTVAPRRTVRFVLTGPAGGCYDVALHSGDTPGNPDVTIVTDPIALCRIAARRLAPAELDATIEGDRRLADLVLADLDSLARD
jgi:uncharacterized protein (TIGR03083 family)